MAIGTLPGMGALQANPYAAAIGAATQLGMEALKPVATTATTNSAFNFGHGGPVVNFGSGTASSAQSQIPSSLQSGPAHPAGVGQALATTAVGVGALASNPAVIALIGICLFLYLKHK